MWHSMKLTGFFQFFCFAWTCFLSLEGGRYSTVQYNSTYNTWICPPPPKRQNNRVPMANTLHSPFWCSGYRMAWLTAPSYGSQSLSFRQPFHFISFHLGDTQEMLMRKIILIVIVRSNTVPWPSTVPDQIEPAHTDSCTSAVRYSPNWYGEKWSGQLLCCCM